AGQCVEFGTHAGSLEDLCPFLRVRDRSVAAEQRRHVNRETGIPHPAREARYMWADAGHFGHHDDGRPLPRGMDLLGDAIEGDVARREIVERVIDLHVAGRHAAITSESILWT